MLKDTEFEAEIMKFCFFISTDLFILIKLQFMNEPRFKHLNEN